MNYYKSSFSVVTSFGVDPSPLLKVLQQRSLGVSFRWIYAANINMIEYYGLKTL